MVTGETENPSLQISSQCVLDGSFSFQVTSGIIECMGHILKAPDSQNKGGAKHTQSNWINIVSGEAQRRYGASMLLPLINVSGKAKQATIEIKEWVPEDRSDSIDDLARCIELGGLRGIKVVDAGAKLGPAGSKASLAVTKPMSSAGGNNERKFV